MRRLYSTTALTLNSNSALALVVHMRDNEVHLSDSERQRLEQYRDAQFGETVPYGSVVVSVETPCRRLNAP